ncbi:MAG: Holliday junction resolvase RuvX, partial [Candidatus Poseidoniales archaeon]
PQYEDHKPHPIAKRIIKFCELLESRVGLEVVRVDESFTSVEAERLIVKKNISREKKKELLDMLSAQLILQDFFSSNVETGA